MTALLSVRELTVNFRTRNGVVHVLDRVSLDVAPGEIVGVVGEIRVRQIGDGLCGDGHPRSGGAHRWGRNSFRGPRRSGHERSRTRRMAWKRGLDHLSEPAHSVEPDPRGRSSRLPMCSPATPRTMRRRFARRCWTLCGRSASPDPEKRAKAFPFELSGGLCQRVGIAMALACAPRLLIADEPTTGLDVTTQAVIMDLIRELARARNLGAVLITHDLALAARYCDRIVVMHAGHVVETATVDALFSHPSHPYTTRLLRSAPSMVDEISQLQAIAGSLPDLRRDDIPNCRFAERCDRRLPACDAPNLTLVPVGPSHSVACRNPL